MSKVKDWRKISVLRERKHEPLVEKLCSSSQNGRRIFPYNKDLMVFAALVGFTKKRTEKVAADGISIILETYASDEKDTFIYLLALVTQKDGVCLKDENLAESVKIFEGYCNAGLGIIQMWLDENPGDPEGIETLIEKIYEQICLNEQEDLKNVSNEEIVPDF